MKRLHHLFGNARITLLTFLLLLVTAGAGCLGCSETQTELDLPPAQAVRLRFPDQSLPCPSIETMKRSEWFTGGQQLNKASRSLLGLL